MDEAMEDGTSGQDRKTYSDDQDRENYTVSTEESTPRVWIGCLACYNNGDLIGGWYAAIGAGDVTTRQVHAAHNITTDDAGYVAGAEVYGPHEELWVMDHEYLPIKGECSPADAQRIAETVEAIKADGHPVAAVAAWWSNVNGGDFPDEWDAPTREAFEESYAGSWPSWQEFADDLAEERFVGEFGMPSTPCDGSVWTAWERANPGIAWLIERFDRDAWAHELEQDHDAVRWVVDTADSYESGVYVFRAV